MAQKIDDTSQPTPELSDRRLRFEGTVELGGMVTGQMLGILFGPESDVNGQLRFGGPVQIDGTYKGSITTDDSLLVGEHAVIEADITCGSATVQGTVTGNITAKDSVALEGQAQVKGDITAPSLSIAKGAMFDGSSRMGTLPTPRKARTR